MVFAKLKNFFAKLIFFPPFFFAQKDFSFPKFQKKFWREKNQLSKKGRSFLILSCDLKNPNIKKFREKTVAS
jgi:hypothetical protein